MLLQTMLISSLLNGMQFLFNVWNAKWVTPVFHNGYGNTGRHGALFSNDVGSLPGHCTHGYIPYVTCHPPVK